MRARPRAKAERLTSYDMVGLAIMVVGCASIVGILLLAILLVR
jgi:hypothetical protein